MKNTKKLLALLLVLMMTVTMFAACGGKKEDATGQSEEVTEAPTEVPASDEELIEEVVMGYTQNALALDAACLDYVDPDSELYANIYDAFGEISMVEAITEGYIAMGIPEKYASQMATIACDASVKALKRGTFEIESIEIDGDSATAYVECEYPNTSELDYSAIGDPEYLFSYYTDEEMEAFREEVATLTTEEEQLDFTLELMLDVLPEALDDLLADVGTADATATIGLKKIDGQWLVETDE